MYKKIKRILREDFSGFIISKIRKYRIKLLAMFSKMITLSKAKLYKISFGKNCAFFGVPTLNRFYNSKIQVGDQCAFRSDRISNLVGINRKCIISTLREGASIIIGNGSRFSGTVIGAADSIIIGNNVLSGANVLITDFDWHPIDPKLRHTSSGVKSAPIIIGNNVWLGVNTVVLKGVSIGENSVIGANSLVVNNIPSNVIAAGNPCHVIKSI